MIVLNDLSRHHAALRTELDVAIARVLDRGWYILGAEVAAFEQSDGAERSFANQDGLRRAVRGGAGLRFQGNNSPTIDGRA